MMHFEITIHNGSYPLTYKCTTATEAFGCIQQTINVLLNEKHIDINLDKIMEYLVGMKQGGMISTENYIFSVRYVESEV